MIKNFKFDKNNPFLESTAEDILRPVGISKGFIAWMGFLFAALAVCLYAYSIQLREGLGVTGMRDYISWGMYIANFVFFVAAALIGMLISAVLGLIGIKWITPVSRIAEIIAVAFAAVAGLVIVSDMGRPDRLPYVFRFGRVQSPILWDVTVVTTYMFISILLWFLPMIPDFEISKTRLKNAPPIVLKVFDILSLKWTHHPKQYKLLLKSMRILLILIIPTAFAIHTVTSWLFAVTPKPGWDSTIFGPYFLTGAFVAGAAAVIVLMFILRKLYKFEAYWPDDLFDKLGKLLVLVSLVYLYFNINEFLVPAYKMKKFDAPHIHELFAGRYAPMFWLSQGFGLILPIILLLFKQMRKPVPLTLVSVGVVIASWFKRFIIVIPTQAHQYLPFQYVPEKWLVYKPTLIEIAVTMASFILVLIIITILSKLFPVLPIWEIAAEKQAESEKEKQ